MNVEYGKFKFELKGASSRVVVIPVHITLRDVHEIVQALFCWGDCRLWEFEDSEGRCYGDKSADGIFPGEVALRDPDAVCLSDVLPMRGCKLRYTYDFGDDWRHEITRMVDPKEPGVRCIKTTGPDGLEDVGGVWGLSEERDQWEIPDAEELTFRLKSIKLSIKESGTGVLNGERNAHNEAVRQLSDAEWNSILSLAERGVLSIFSRRSRLEKFLSALPGVRQIMMPNALGPTPTYVADPEFRRFWRKNGENWMKLRTQK